MSAAAARVAAREGEAGRSAVVVSPVAARPLLDAVLAMVSDPAAMADYERWRAERAAAADAPGTAP